ncbi:acetylglutamate kinase [Aestuariispira insulae]|uniref:Acetylglutamate kinase n=1 Tax=Aestuariispira insulae TaxID=1461337 RepID=A0A3D9H6A5_9PROT|nr:acetylglutamate kinase [Aestuariispira insulae]RED45030.1 N-acetylglutamate kinase [Aestuariispira insulae]
MSTEKNQRRLEWLEKAGILTEALPNMRRYSGKSITVKYGGHAMGDATLAKKFASDIVLLKQVGINPVVVHGGGPQIGAMLKKLEKESEFVDGLRVTDEETVAIAEMVLSGSLNKSIVAAIQSAGGNAVGLSGKDGGLITARKITRTKKDPDSNIEKVLDLGFVGEPVAVNPSLLVNLMAAEFIPVIAPIGWGEDEHTYNINADTAAGAIASATNSRRLLMLTDVAGVLDKEGKLIREMNVSRARELMEDGTLSGGMIPKVETCIKAIEEGADAAVILDGRHAHAVLLEIFTEMGAGTLIKAG